MHRRLRSLISAVVLFVHAVVGIATVHAEWLCVGADGHLAFAGVAGDDKCHDESAPSESSEALLTEVAERGFSPDCTDLVLPGRSSLKIQEHGADIPPVLLAWINIALFDGDAIVQSVPAVGFGASSARTLTSHRTTVLLI